MKVIICGDRNWRNPAPIELVLRGLRQNLGHGQRITVLEGEAKGADTLARQVAEKLRAEWDGEDWGWATIEVWAFPAKWGEYGKAAGPKRNQAMLDNDPDLVIAFHDDLSNSKGTKDMVKRARRKGTPVYVIGHGPKSLT